MIITYKKINSFMLNNVSCTDYNSLLWFQQREYGYITNSFVLV